MKGLKLNIFAPSRMMIKGNQLKPNFSFDVEGINTFVTCINDEANLALIVKTNFSMESVKCIETSTLDKRGSRVSKSKQNSIMDRASILRDS